MFPYFFVKYTQINNKEIKMKGYHLKIIRHGMTDANLNGTYIGVTDLPLSSEGKQALLDKQDKFDYTSVQRVYSSPLKRCIQTANILYPDVYVRTVNEIREVNFGDFEGKTADELVNNPAFKEWLKGGLDNAPPNGESMREVIERCYLGFDFIIKDMMQEGLTNCAVITHGGIIMNSLSCFGVPKYKPMDLSCDFGEGYELLVTAQLWQVSNAFELLGQFPYFREENNDTDEE
jgi:alpha-ribazole phosphatase